jgi:hypothetical protein
VKYILRQALIQRDGFTVREGVKIKKLNYFHSDVVDTLRTQYTYLYNYLCTYSFVHLSDGLSIHPRIILLR